MNKTKIVATIGPSSQSKKVLTELIEAGMDVARINLKHATNDFCRDVVNNINDINKELNKNIAVMFDTRGPEIRVDKFVGGKTNLTKGSKIRVYMGTVLGDETKFSVNYSGLINDVFFDTILKINDGKVVLKVIDKGVDYLLCIVLVGGEVSDHKGMNAIGVTLNKPFLSLQDKKDIKFANELNVDFLALSFVESHENVLEVNDLLINLGNDHIGIISKIENERAYEDLDEIIKFSDGAMVARGDLGVEVSLERVPGMQKVIINKCMQAGKVSIVATEMLSSMERSSVPTRAEVSDVANAVLDGADAVMLSGETTVGKYPALTVETMSKISTTAEEDIDYFGFMDKAMRTENRDITGMIAHNVAQSADYLNCKAIFTPTMSGYTAKKISRFRPNCPIIAVSPNVDTVKSLQLHFGVEPILIDEIKSLDKIIDVSKKLSADVTNLKSGDKYIITGGYPFKEVKHTNFMKIEEL